MRMPRKNEHACRCVSARAYYMKSESVNEWLSTLLNATMRNSVSLIEFRSREDNR
jgi:hypothetical protein